MHVNRLELTYCFFASLSVLSFRSRNSNTVIVAGVFIAFLSLAGSAELYSGKHLTIHLKHAESSGSEEFFRKELAIRKQTGDKHGEAAANENLAAIYQSRGEYSNAKECLIRALVIREEIGDKKGEAASYGNLGSVFQSLGEYAKAQECFQKALMIRKEIGDKEGEASSYGNLGTVFQSLGEYVKAEEYYQKALVIRKEIGDKIGEATDYGNLGTVFLCFGEYVKAKEYYTKSLTLSKANGCMFEQFQCHANMAWAFFLEGNIQEAVSRLSVSIGILEKMRGFLRDVDEYKISLLDEHGSPYLLLSALYCATGKALADIMSAQYSLKKEISVNPQSCVGIEKIMKKESNSTCLYISYYKQQIFLWILKPSTGIALRQVDISDCFSNKKVPSVGNLFENIALRSFHILPHDHCEDRSLNCFLQTLVTCHMYHRRKIAWMLPAF